MLGRALNLRALTPASTHARVPFRCWPAQLQDEQLPRRHPARGARRKLQGLQERRLGDPRLLGPGGARPRRPRRLARHSVRLCALRCRLSPPRRAHGARGQARSRDLAGEQVRRSARQGSAAHERDGRDIAACKTRRKVGTPPWGGTRQAFRQGRKARGSRAREGCARDGCAQRGSDGRERAETVQSAAHRCSWDKRLGALRGSGATEAARRRGGPASEPTRRGCGSTQSSGRAHAPCVRWPSLSVHAPVPMCDPCALLL